MQSMSLAVTDAVAANDRSTDLSIALDGSWQKREHTSLNGILSTTSLDTGQVVDIQIVSKFCNCHSKFEKSSSSNYHGTSGAMEVAGAVQIFQRSLSEYNVRYVNYLGVGDTKACADVCQSKPYGDDAGIKKQKAQDISIKGGPEDLTNEDKNNSDDTLLGGKNRLTDAAILKLQTY